MKKLHLLMVLLISSFYSSAQNDLVNKQIAFELVKKHAGSIGVSAENLANLSVKETYIVEGSTIRMVYLQQNVSGIPIYNQIQVLAFKNDKLVSNAGELLKVVGQQRENATAKINAEDAVQATMASLQVNKYAPITTAQKNNSGKFSFGKLNTSVENITAELMWLPRNDKGELKLVWQVFIAPVNQDDYWIVNIDATTNQFISKQSLTIKCNWDGENHSATTHKKNHLKTENIGNKVLNQYKTDIGQVVNSANYRVIAQPAESPIHTGGAPVLVSNPWTKSPGNATSLGWHYDGTTYYSTTRGNNVHAYEDRANTNAPGITETSTTAQPDLNFDFVPNLALEPTVRTTAPNQQFNTTNLFYWNNLMHDLSYLYGFNEAARNFQSNNQGRGGTGNDYVKAEAQDGSGTNNANFSTPADGGSGRMQMYLWTAPTPDRDGDVDNGIIAHEYTHGISNRLTGNGSTCLTNAEQMGEGWSDYYGLMITHDWATAVAGDGFSKPRGIGTYALNQTTTGLGIRQYKYTTDMAVNPMTYGNLASVVAPHGVGTIWCTALWDMTWEIIQLQGINPNIFNIGGGGGNAIALKLVTEGMRLQPCSPGFIDGRNAILKADTLFFGAQYSCAIIKAFARRGMGIGALQGSSNSRTDQTLSFVECSTATSCNAPTGLASSAITSTNATISWTAASGAVSYLIEYKTAAATTWTVAASATTATSISLTGLTASTAYNWRVTTNCSSTTSTATTANFTTTAVPSGCATAFEPNETQATSATIVSGVTNSAAINSTTDVDYYKIVTTATSGNVYNLVGPSGVDYDMYIYNSAGTQIGSGTGSTATETVSLTSQAAGTYYIRIIGYNGANSTTCYTIKATATSATGCQSSLDNATNGTISGAAVIPFNTNVTGLISPSGDNDYYKFVITTGGTATVTLTTLPGDYDLTVVNSAGTQLAISQNGSTTSETITRTYTAGIYYARVFGYNNANNATVCYTLKVQLGTASLIEQNTPEITQTGLLKIYPNPVTDFVNVSVLGNIDRQSVVNVIDVNGNIVMSTKLNSNIQRINVAALPKGVYMLRLNNGTNKLSSKFVKQ